MKESNNIPEGLLNFQRKSSDISILIGENGGGKSTLLNELSKHYLSFGDKVIAIANSIHDKFESSHRNFSALRGRSGRRQTRSVLKKALEIMAKGDISQNLKSATRVLEYVNFEPVFGFKVENLSQFFQEKIKEADIGQSDKEQLIYLLESVVRESRNDEIIWLELRDFNITQLQKSVLIELFIWESKLRSLEVIERIEVYLRKNGKVISMLNASSGELALITTIVYLSSVIDERTVILVDEPENSLHPKWQKEYVQILFELFYYYQPKVIIATHSPLVVNGAELFTDNPHIYKSHNFTFELQKKEPLNLEETYFRFFNITTPQNRFLTEQVIRLLNFIAAEKINLDVFNNEIDKISQNSYDPKQREALNAVKSIAVDIVNNSQQ